MSKNNISRTLSKLGIKNNQQGCSNGSEWFGSGSKIDSFSPVDGSKLGNVSTGTKKDYENVDTSLENESFDERNNDLEELYNSSDKNSLKTSIPSISTSSETS